jgi:hypothetical protein
MESTVALPEVHRRHKEDGQSSKRRLKTWRLPVINKEDKKNQQRKQHKLFNPNGLGDKTSTGKHPGGKQTPHPNGREKQAYPPMVETIEGQKKPPRELGGPETEGREVKASKLWRRGLSLTRKTGLSLTKKRKVDEKVVYLFQLKA